MKKTILYSLALLATIGLASCDGDYDDWTSPQSYSQEESAAKFGITFANGPEASTTLPDNDGTIRLVQINATDSAISGVTLKSLTVNGQDISGSVDGYYIAVSANDLAKMAYAENGTRAAKATPLTVETKVSINLNTGDAVTFNTVGQTTGSITPEAVPETDSNGYFLLGDFEGYGWHPDTPLWMTDNGDGTYSATVTTISFNAKNYFKIYEGSTWSENCTWDDINAKQIGCETDGDVSLDNLAVWQGDPVYTSGPKSPAIYSLGTYTITFDPANMKYNIRRAPSKYYLINYANRYVTSVPTSGHNLMLYNNGDNVYTMTTQWRGTNDVKLWDTANFGNSAMFFGAESDDPAAEVKDESGSVTQGPNAGFITAPAAGWYKLTVDMNSSTYTWTTVAEPTVTYTSVIINGEAMSHRNNAPHNWYKEITVSADTQVHFTGNGGKVWGAASAGNTISDTDYSFGTGTNDVTLPAGTYRCYLNDIDGTWNIVKE